jgi:hypothetical protein
MAASTASSTAMSTALRVRGADFHRCGDEGGGIQVIQVPHGHAGALGCQTTRDVAADAGFAGLLALRSEPLDTERHDVARLEIDRGRLLAMPTPGGVPVAMMSPGISVMKRLT